MSLSAGRVLSNPRPLRSLAAIARQRPQRRFVGTHNPEPPKPIEPSNTQAMPIGAYYESILNTPQPIPDVKPEEPPASANDEPEAPSPPKGRGRKAKEEKPSASTEKKAAAPEPSTVTSPPIPTPPPKSAQEQAKMVFGSRLVGPKERAERLAQLRSRSTLIAGVLVPPKPNEPDNCCMSGCVNCVWDVFRDEMEEWATASAQAEKRLRAQEAGLASNATVPPPVGVSGVGPRGSDHHAASMDEDGGGSETNWDATGKDPEKLAKNFWDEELYQNIPVGIREFMKQEKKLKEKHLREGTVASLVYEHLKDFTAYHQNHPEPRKSKTPVQPETYYLSQKNAMVFVKRQAMQLASPVSPTGDLIDGSPSRVAASLSPENTMKLIAILNHNIYATITDAEKKVERPLCTDPLLIIGRGKASTVYSLPESFAGVLKFGNARDITREKFAIEKVNEGFKIYYHHIHKQRFSRRVCGKSARIEMPHFPRVMASLVAGDQQLRQFRERMPAQASHSDKTSSHHGLILPRINPFTVGIRRQIVGKYFTAKAKKAALADTENEHCLIRPLLGLNRSDYDQSASALPALHDEETSLRDFPAYFCQLESYLSPHWLRHLVKQIAVSYAVMHWGAGLDGRGVEMLLGMTRSGKANLCLVDFEGTGDVASWSRDEIEYRLVPAVHGSDAYIPRPSVSPEMWELFEDTYCDIAYDLIQACPEKYGRATSAIMELPEHFTALLKAAFERDEYYKSIDDDYIQFASDTDVESQDEDSDEVVYDEDSDEDSEDVVVEQEEEKAATPAPHTSWADEMDKVDPVLPNWNLAVPAAPAKPKKSVRFADWRNEVFEVPADEEARKIADIRYLYPQYTPVEDEDDEEDEGEGDDVRYEGYGAEYEDNYEEYGPSPCYAADGGGYYYGGYFYRGGYVDDIDVAYGHSCEAGSKTYRHRRRDSL